MCTGTLTASSRHAWWKASSSSRVMHREMAFATSGRAKDTTATCALSAREMHVCARACVRVRVRVCVDNVLCIGQVL